MNKKNRRGSVEPSLDVLGPLQDIIRQVREGKLTKEHLQAFSERRNPFQKKEAALVTSLKYDKTKDGWTLLEDVEFDGKPFVPDIVKFLKFCELSVNGDTMRARAKELNANLGQRRAEYLLDHQELIPKEWRGKYYLTFPGTVWRDSNGDRGVPYLRWIGDEWYLSFNWLRGDWDSDARLVGLRK